MCARSSSNACVSQWIARTVGRREIIREDILKVMFNSERPDADFIRMTITMNDV
jgi:hypothetical protein